MQTVTQQLSRREPPTLEDERDRGQAAVPRPMLHHVQLQTNRLAEMVRWYSSTLGLIISHRGSSAAWLTNDEANHRVALLSTPKLTDDPDKLEHAGLHHTAWEYATLDDLLAVYAGFVTPASCPTAPSTTVRRRLSITPIPTATASSCRSTTSPTGASRSGS